MNPADKSPTIIVHEESDSLEELSEYLDVLSSSARLRIVKFLEKKPRDARAISNEIETSYENTKKHLDKLLGIGVIKKEAGLGAPTSKGIHPVWEYSVDQINIMSYGPGDTYDLTSYADSYAQAGFPYEKMIGGVESESGYPENGGPDTQASVVVKCAYVKDHKLAGLFEWRMDNDMRSGDGPPTFMVTGWMSDCLAG